MTRPTERDKLRCTLELPSTLDNVVVSPSRILILTWKACLSVDGSETEPKVLRPHMSGVERIAPM